MLFRAIAMVCATSPLTAVSFAVRCEIYLVYAPDCRDYNTRGKRAQEHFAGPITGASSNAYSPTPNAAATARSITSTGGWTPVQILNEAAPCHTSMPTPFSVSA